MHNERGVEAGVYGAPVERGTIRSIEKGMAVVVSLDRDGMVTMPMEMMCAAEVGDAVFFCEFDDGNGLVVSKMDPEDATGYPDIGALSNKELEAMLK